MKAKITGYFSIILTDKGEIKKEFFAIAHLRDLKKYCKESKLTLLFYFPSIVFVSKALSLEELEVLFFYLSQFLSAHLPLKKSFENLQTVALSKQGQETVQQLSKHIQDGNSLEQFFKERHIVKDPVILSTLLVAERMGRWDRIFNDLNEFIKNKRDNQNKLRSILMYPFLVVFALILFMIFILPPIVSNISQFSQGSSQETPFIVNFVSFVDKYNFIFLMFFACCCLLGVLFKKNILKTVHLLLRKIVGIDFELEHFFYLMSFLLRQKVPLPESLSILAKENSFASIRIGDIHKALQDGESFSTAFTQQKRFPHFVISLLDLSQETSSLSENIERIHLILNKMHGRNIQKAISMLPNVLILIVGGIFITLIVTIFLPIYDQALRLSGDIG